MKRLRRILACLLGLLLLSGCPKPSIPALSDKAADSTVGVATTTLTSPYEIRGQVDMQALYRTQANMQEVGTGATVSLIHAQTGQTLGSSVTTSSGAFVLQFGYTFRPQLGTYYYLEAVKGLQAGGLPNRAGASVARVRTLMTWQSDNQWHSISGLSSTGINISRSTTALSIIASLRSFSANPVNQTALIGSLIAGQAESVTGANPVSIPDTFSAGGSLVSNIELHQVWGLVDSALTLNQDPVFTVLYDTASGNYSLVPQSVALQGVSPGTGAIGQTITIYGQNFATGTSLSSDQVRFNGTLAASVSVNTYGTQLYVQIPPGATTGPLFVQVNSVVFGGLYFAVSSWDGHTPFDATGDLYVTGRTCNTLFTVSSAGAVNKVLTGGLLNAPRGVAVFGSKVYISNSGSGTITQYDPSSGGTTTYASGLNAPWGLVFDPNGNLYVANTGANTVVKIATGSALVTTYATGFNQPAGLALATTGDLWVANSGNSTVSLVSAANQTVTTPITSGLKTPEGLAVDSLGNLIIANYGLNSLMRYSTSGVYTPLMTSNNHMGIDAVAYDTSGLLWIGAQDSHSIATLNSSGAVQDLVFAPIGINCLSADSNNNLYIGVRNNGRWIGNGRPRDGQVYRVAYNAGNGTYGPFVPYAAGFTEPNCVALDPNNNVYVAESSTNKLYRVNPDGTRYVYAQGFISTLQQVGFDSVGNMWVSTRNWGAQRVATGSNTVSTYIERSPTAIAYNPTSNVYYLAYDREGGIVQFTPSATGEWSQTLIPAPYGFSSPRGLAWYNGSLYIADWGNNRIVQYTPGTGAWNYTYCTGLSNPAGLAFNTSTGVLYVTNSGDGSLRSVPAGGGAATTLLTGLGDTRGLVLAPNGKLYCTQYSSLIIREITLGSPSTLSNATFATLPANTGGTVYPWGIAVDVAGNLYVAAGYKWLGQVFRIPPTGGTATAIGNVGGWLSGVTLDGSGNVYAAAYNNRTDNMRPIQKFASGTWTRTDCGTTLMRSMGIGVDSLNRAYFFASNWGGHQHVSRYDPSTDSWQRIIDNGSMATGPYNPYIDKSNNDVYIPFLRSHIVRKFPGGSTTGTVDYPNLGWVTCVIKSPNGDLIVGSSLSGPGNAILSRIPSGSTTAVPLDNWFYQPAF